MTLPVIVTVEHVPGGIELHATGHGQHAVIRLAAVDALTLADDITRACEQPLRAVS